MMDVKELSQLKMSHSNCKPFSLTSCGRMLVLIGSENHCTLLKPIYVPKSNEDFSFAIESLTASKCKPTEFYSNNFNIKSICNRANVLQRQAMLLDPLYALDFMDTPTPEPQINCICAPSRAVFNIPVVAVVSNYGACEIRTKSIWKRTWDKTVLNINNLWPTIFNLPNHNESDTETDNIQDVINYVEDLHITNCCWSEAFDENNVSKLYCSTASGWIISLAIRLEGATFIDRIKTSLYKINRITSFIAPGNIDKIYLLASDINGIIKLLEDQGDKLKEISTLWSKHDKMLCRKFDVEICKKTGNIIVISSKASHFLVFVLDQTGCLLDRCSRYVGGIEITGIEMCEPTKYLVATLTGHVECITVTFCDQKINLDATNVPHNMDCSNYHMLGLCGTSNKVAWIFVLYPTGFYNARMKNVCILSVFTLNKEAALDLLQKSEKLNIDDFADCVGVIRTIISKNGPMDCYMQFNPEPVQINDSFLDRLRIRLIIVQSLALFSRNKLKQKGEIHEIEIHSICNTIRAILIYKRLNHLLNVRNLSEFQKLSGMCLRRALLHYLKENCNQQFASIREIFIPVIEPLLERTEKLFEGKKEKCLYCGEVNDPETGMCAAQHEMKRCSISYVQIPLLSGNRWCKFCGEVSLEDETLLTEILAPNEEVQCALYGCPLIKVSNLIEE